MEEKQLYTLLDFHEAYEAAFKNTDFGSMEYPRLILGGLQKVAQGYWNGRTMQMILLELKLIMKKNTGTSPDPDYVLTEKGLDHLIALSALTVSLK